jgi:uncharacterized protein
VIIDFHTHIFPPDVRDRRDDYIRRDPTFAEMYTNPRAEIANAEDLLASMDESGVDISVALGFAWRDHDDIVRHNDYLLEIAAKSNGRIIPFTTINMSDDRAGAEIERCAKAGARGLGELRPENQGWDSAGDPGDLLATLAEALDLTLLFHVTEPVGHEYPGKHGFRLDLFYRFLIQHPGTKIVGAHMAGGLPLFQNYIREMGKVGYHFYADTAAWAHIFRSRKNLIQYGIQTFDSRRLLFGSDFPLVTQAEAIEKINFYTKEWSKGGLPWVFGGNAAKFLGSTP